MCQEWSDAEPALLSRCVEGSDVPNAPGMHTNFTCVLWIYRSCPISKLSGCVSPLIRIEAEQFVSGFSTQPVSLPHKCSTPASRTKSLTLHPSIPHTCMYTCTCTMTTNVTVTRIVRLRSVSCGCYENKLMTSTRPSLPLHFPRVLKLRTQGERESSLID